MKVLHSISTSDGELVKWLSNAGLTVDSATGALTFFDGFDAQAQPGEWARIAEVLRAAKRRGAYVGIATKTVFSDAERDSADWLMLEPAWVAGYPVGETYWDFLEATFDCECRCEECGGGAIQVNPIVFRSEPKWHKRSMLRLFWLDGVAFLRREMYVSIFEPLGGACLPVLDGRGKALPSIVQLRAPVGVPLDIPDTRAAICSQCGREQYAALRYGYAPSPLSTPAALVTSSQLFGAGGGFAPIFVTAALFARAKKAGMMARDFYPCRPGAYETDVEIG